MTTCSYRSSDGLSLTYRDVGNGRPLLCLAGLTRNSRDFDYLILALPEVRIIAPDYRGRGDSDWDADPLNYTPAIEARDVVELLDHLEIPSLPIIATSRGGIVAMMLAATACSKVTGVCLNDIGPVIEGAGLESIAARIGFSPGHRTYEEAALALAENSPDFPGVPFFRWEAECKRRYNQVNGSLEINYDPGLRDAFLKDYQGQTTEIWSLYDALNGLPVSVIRGENSNLLSAETTAEIQARYPSHAITTVLDRGHVPFLDEPESVAAIREFLANTS